MKQIFTLFFLILSLSFFTTAQTLDGSINKHVLFSVYPNPAIDETTVAIEASGDDAAQLTIYNAVGELVYQQPFNSSGFREIKIDLTEFQKGVYIIQINGSIHKATKKLIVK